MARQQHLLQRDLSSEEGLEIASGVMVERKMRLEKGYHRALAKIFRTHPHQVDFTKPDQAATVINAWISDHTVGTYSLQLIASHLEAFPIFSANSIKLGVSILPSFQSFVIHLLSFLL